MPRFVGKKSNPTASIALILLGIGLGIAAVCEYVGIISIIPNFGKTNRPIQDRSVHSQPVMRGGKYHV